MLTAVAVWDHRPSADELLARRVERGWRPQVTALQSGPAVLGHAACLVPEGGSLSSSSAATRGS